MKLSAQQMAQMSRLLKHALLLDEEGRRRWLEELAPEHLDLKPALRQALLTPDIFEVIDWPEIFGVRATPLQQALDETFQDPVYSQVTLDF